MAKGNRQNEDGTGFVYIFKAGSIYKIGRTNNVGRRLSEIQRTHPDAEVYHSRKVKGAAMIKDWLLGAFHRKCMGGEWFSLDDQDLNLAIYAIGVIYGA